MTIFTSAKLDYIAKKIIIDQGGDDVVIKGLLYQEDIGIWNVLLPKNKVEKYIKQKLTELKGEIENFTLIFGDFKTTLSNS